MKITIYYFSGTGNSMYIAQQLYEKLPKSELIPIASFARDQAVSVLSEKILFVFPLYYFGLPEIVRHFVENLIIPENTYICSIVTAMSPAGAAMFQMNQLLEEKGQSLNIGYYVRMPNNFFYGYTLDPQKKVQKLTAKADKQLGLVVKVILKGKTSKVKDKASGKKMANHYYDEWLQNVHNSDSQYEINKRCTNCGICEKACPVANISMGQNGPQFHEQCQQCLACIHNCPEVAIMHKEYPAKVVRYRHPKISVRDLMQQRALFVSNEDNSR